MTHNAVKRIEIFFCSFDNIYSKKLPFLLLLHHSGRLGILRANAMYLFMNAFTRPVRCLMFFVERERELKLGS